LKFEVVANAYKLPAELWSVELAKCLSGESLAVYENLSPENRVNYKAIINALKKKYGLTLSSYRKKFLQARCTENENLSDYVSRLRRYYLEWLEKAGYTSTYEGILEHTIKDRFFESQESSVKVFIKERGKTLSLEEMIALADDYVEAHNVYERKDNGKNQVKQKFTKPTDQKKEGQLSEMKSSTKFDNTRKNYSRTDSSTITTETSRKPLVCFNCNKPGHKAAECRSKADGNTTNSSWKPQLKTAACQLINPVEVEEVTLDSETKNVRKWPTVAITGQDDVQFLKDLKYPYRGKAKDTT
jgi:hypothetical protein